MVKKYFSTQQYKKLKAHEASVLFKINSVLLEGMDELEKKEQREMVNLHRLNLRRE